MERLPFGSEEPHEAVEASIHVARYATAQPYCSGLDVLDVACGEGYGSYLMSEHWGANSVLGVDLSSDAVDRARTNFSAENIQFLEASVDELVSKLEPSSFDLAVSFETIEHLLDPRALLHALRALVKPGGTIIVSCPNDRWYYPEPSVSNPFHVRKFSEEEFHELAVSVLGEPRIWLRGSAVAGFMNVSDESVTPRSRLAGISRLGTGTGLVTVPPDEAVGANDCAYFVGIWGADVSDEHTSGAVYSQSMDLSELGIRRRAEEVANVLHSQLEAAYAELGRARLKERIAEQENALIRDSVRVLADSAAVEFREAMASQAALIDERDLYIRELEARLDSREAAESRRLFGRIRRSRRRFLPARGSRST